MRLIRVILYLILGIIGISFAALNAGSVQVNFYVTQMTVPISVLMILMVALGFVIGVLISLLKYWQLKINLHRTKNLLKVTEKEIKNLRDIPLKNQH